MSWDYEPAGDAPQNRGRPGWRGRWLHRAPTISLLDGGGDAPPAALAVVEGAPGYTVTEHTIQRLPCRWATGWLACGWGKTLVILGRLEEP